MDSFVDKIFCMDNLELIKQMPDNSSGRYNDLNARAVIKRDGEYIAKYARLLIKNIK